jgi:SAM-dependent methyltransferase
MHQELIDLLCCPTCSGQLTVREGRIATAEIKDGTLACTQCCATYPIVNYVARFVESSVYSQPFGFQWNRFRKTQLDSHTRLPLSRERFFSYSGWQPSDLKGKLVLDAGCGAGRFAEIALSAGARLVALDYSSAVDACWQNLGPAANFDVLQADIYTLPLKADSFDFVYCLGVLQHTPDVRKAFMALPPKLKAGGRLTVDIYPKLLRNLVWSKYWIRPITKRLPQDQLFRLVEVMVKTLLPVSMTVCRIPYVGKKLRYAIPVANHQPDWPLSPTQLREWAVLNTFDMLAPLHDHPQTQETLTSWFKMAGLKDVEVFRKGFYVGRGVR